jgi:aminoglycoside 2''-phosphotransferase
MDLSACSPTLESEMLTETEKQASCLETLHAAYPDLEILTARLHTSGGQFSDILFVNENLIFRFPRYAEGIPGFLRETELLTKLQGQLPLPIPNPLYISQGTAEPGQVFMGYKVIPGEPLWRNRLNEILDEAVLEGFARQLAGFLHALHGLNPATLGLSLPQNNVFAAQTAFYAEVRTHLFGLMRPEARDLVAAHFENYFSASELHTYTPGFYHGDFGGSNILHDPVQMVISGLLDFGFAGYGDPAFDLASVSTYGDAFFARLCRYYPVTESMLARARFYRGTFALQEALHGFQNNDQAAFDSGMEQYV